jgi:hypothetical protein
LTFASVPQYKQSYRKVVDSWTFVGLRNRVVKDIRKMIGKMIWDAREEAEYLEEKQSAFGARSSCREESSFEEVIVDAIKDRQKMLPF